MTGAPISEALRAKLHARFPKEPRWFPPMPPWELIRAAVAKGRADGLDDTQLAGGIYTALASHGLILEGRS